MASQSSLAVSYLDIWYSYVHCLNFDLCRDADKVSRRVADVLKDVASLEMLQAPGVPFIIPDQFASLPRLTGAHPRFHAFTSSTPLCTPKHTYLTVHEH